jgi:hypothetical protein
MPTAATAAAEAQATLATRPEATAAAQAEATVAATLAVLAVLADWATEEPQAWDARRQTVRKSRFTSALGGRRSSAQPDVAGC